MTEKEKAALGLEYNPNKDEELLAQMRRTHTLVQQYNSIPFDDEKARADALKEIIDIGEGGTVISPFFCDYGYNIHIGDNFFANTNFTVLDGARVEIGNNVFIGPNVGIYTAEHSLDPFKRAEGIETARPVRIGDNVWIGGHVCILAGVTIGARSVIGAGSTVTRDIPEDCIAVGSPCRVLRKLDARDNRE